MKKIVKEILMLVVSSIILLSLSGCARVNCDVNINKDGSANVCYIMGYDKEFLNSMGISEEELGEQGLEDMENGAKEDGYIVEKYNDDQTVGFKATKHFAKISDFNVDDLADKEISKDENNRISFEKKLLDTKIYQNAKVDLTTLNDEAEGNEVNNIANILLKQMKITYKVEIPFTVGNNNASSVSDSGKTLEWTLKPGEVNEIYFQSEHNLNMLVLICVIAIVIIVLITIILLANKKGKLNKIKNTVVKENKKIDNE